MQQPVYPEGMLWEMLRRNTRLTFDLHKSPYYVGWGNSNHFIIMMPKPTLLTFLLSLFLLFFSSVQAGTVYNQSPWTLRYTTNPRADTGCTSCCFFWNWRNGSPRSQQTTCTQRNLSSKQSAGAEGFCYADVDYYFSGRKITKGQWTKIGSQTPRCVSYRGQPHCCVTGDPASAGCCWGVAPGPNGIVCS